MGCGVLSAERRAFPVLHVADRLQATSLAEKEIVTWRRSGTSEHVRIRWRYGVSGS